ncbi:TPA: ead/Ea22-like family protein [Yersinia enterocolitica]
MNNTEELKKAALEATQGEWWQDVVETEGTYGVGDDCSEGFHSYAVYGPDNRSLLDMTNSTAAIIHTEDDGDYRMAWDETGRRNAEFIALANPSAILDLIAQLEAAQLELIKPLPIGELVHRLEVQTYEKWFSESDVKDLRERAEAAEAALSAANEMVPVTIDSGVIRDANRYRFLRDEDSWGEDSDSWDVETKTGLISSENLMELRLDHFDAAIDARMAASDIPFLNPANASQKPVVMPERYSFDCGVCADPNGEWVAVDDIKDAIKATGGTVEE